MKKRLDREKKRGELYTLYSFVQENFRWRFRAARLANKPKKFVFHELDSAESTRKFLDEHVKESNDPEVIFPFSDFSYGWTNVDLVFHKYVKPKDVMQKIRMHF